MGQVHAGCGDSGVMWLFTPSGFFSIVPDQQTPGHAPVRARVHEDLEAFCERTGAPPPRETPEP